MTANQVHMDLGDILYSPRRAKEQFIDGNNWGKPYVIVYAAWETFGSFSGSIAEKATSYHLLVAWRQA